MDSESFHWQFNLKFDAVVRPESRIADPRRGGPADMPTGSSGQRGVGLCRRKAPAARLSLLCTLSP